MEPEFLSLAEVVEIHSDQIRRYGGSPDILDLAMLQSAVAAPRAAFSGELLHHDIYAMAAAYLFHVVRNHPFVDGNKRTGTVAALVFLAMNGVRFEAEGRALETLVLSVARGDAAEDEVAGFLRAHSRSRT